MSEAPVPRKQRRNGCLVAVGAFTVALVALVAVSAYAVGRFLERVDGAPPPSPEHFATASEIGTHGDPPDIGPLFGGAYPNDGNTQARDFERPARLSGYTTFVDAIERVPTSTFVDGYEGDYLRVHARVFNRDRAAQDVGAAFFRVWHNGESRTPDVVAAPRLPRTTAVASGDTLEGDVYLYVGTARDDVFVVFEPTGVFEDAHAVWKAG
jgi:hypothetical protein